MNREAFFASLRGGAIFPHGFTQQQVGGFTNLLDVWEKHYFADPMNPLAYDLATAFHEAAGTMQPIKERGPVSYFVKYEPGTKIGNALCQHQETAIASRARAMARTPAGATRL